MEIFHVFDTASCRQIHTSRVGSRLPMSGPLSSRRHAAECEALLETSIVPSTPARNPGARLRRQDCDRRGLRALPGAGAATAGALRAGRGATLMARGRPISDFDRLLTSAESPEVLWQASATMGEVRYGERRRRRRRLRPRHRDHQERDAHPHAAVEVQIDGLIERSAQSRILAQRRRHRRPRTVCADRARFRDGTLGGFFPLGARHRPRALGPITLSTARRPSPASASRPRVN